MEKKSVRHLIVVLGGCGLAIPGASLLMWALSNVELGRVNEYGFAHEIGGVGLWPMLLIAGALLLGGILCIVGAMLCESGRYDKK